MMHMKFKTEVVFRVSIRSGVDGCAHFSRRLRKILTRDGGIEANSSMAMTGNRVAHAMLGKHSNPNRGDIHGMSMRRSPGCRSVTVKSYARA
jgi:hypothetical protein